jgi:uncharacterized protein (DUF1501 family)
MIRLDADRPAVLCDGVSRRAFLQAGALPAVGLTLAGALQAHVRADTAPRQEVNCIFLFLLGGPSHLDTWDPKPGAPAEVRGPFAAVGTNVPGMQVTELFPRMARRAHRFAIVRGVHHEAPAVHDTGHQLLQTGRLFSPGVEHPHAGCVLAHLRGTRPGAPPSVVLPGPMGPTGGNLPHGQTAGYLAARAGAHLEPLLVHGDAAGSVFRPAGAYPVDEPLGVVRTSRRVNLRTAVEAAVPALESAAATRGPAFQQAFELAAGPRARSAFSLDEEPAAVRDAYGRHRFGQSCLLARRLVERGTGFVTVNMFETVFHQLSWDMHGAAPFTTIQQYRDTVAPWFDQAYTALLDDLAGRGLLDSTLVVALGEFGRTPKLNAVGGRDHWPQCWSVLFAGGGVRGGQVLGGSDALGAFPAERPVTPAEVTATLYRALGVPLGAELPGPGGSRIPVVEPGTQPLAELLPQLPPAPPKATP